MLLTMHIELDPFADRGAKVVGGHALKGRAIVLWVNSPTPPTKLSNCPLVGYTSQSQEIRSDFVCGVVASERNVTSSKKCDNAPFVAAFCAKALTH